MADENKVNYTGDNTNNTKHSNGTPSAPSAHTSPANTNTANPVLIREALDSLHTLRTIPRDLHHIAGSLEETSKPKHGVFIAYVACLLVIAVMAYMLITSHLNEIMANSRLDLNTSMEKSRQDNADALATLEKTYKANLETLNTNLNTQSTTINKQIDSAYKMVHDGYQAQLKNLETIVADRDETIARLKLELSAQRKENERMQRLINTISKASQLQTPDDN